MEGSPSGRDRYKRSMSEEQVHWARGVLIVGCMLGVVLLFLVVWSLLQYGTKDAPEIRGLAPIAASGTAGSAGQATATAAAAATPTPITATARQSPYVRSGPGTNYEIIGSLQEGSSVPVIGRTPDGSWLQVMLPNGQRGWSGSGLLTVAGGVTSIPVTQ